MPGGTNDEHSLSETAELHAGRLGGFPSLVKQTAFGLV
jgi:hypothetical protein